MTTDVGGHGLMSVDRSLAQWLECSVIDIAELKLGTVYNYKLNEGIVAKPEEGIVGNFYQSAECH